MKFELKKYIKISNPEGSSGNLEETRRFLYREILKTLANFLETIIEYLERCQTSKMTTPVTKNSQSSFKILQIKSSRLTSPSTVSQQKSEVSQRYRNNGQELWLSTLKLLRPLRSFRSQQTSNWANFCQIYHKA